MIATLPPHVATAAIISLALINLCLIIQRVQKLVDRKAAAEYEDLEVQVTDIGMRNYENETQ